MTVPYNELNELHLKPSSIDAAWVEHVEDDNWVVMISVRGTVFTVSKQINYTAALEKLINVKRSMTPWLLRD